MRPLYSHGLFQFLCLSISISDLCQAFQIIQTKKTIDSSSAWKKNIPNILNKATTRHQTKSTAILTSTQLNSISRRNIFQNSIAASLYVQYLLPPPKRAYAVESSMDLPNGLLEARVLENVLSPPPYGMESSDVLYPK